MKSSSDSPTPASQPFAGTSPLTLRIRDLGHVPSFKNTKSILRRRDGSPFIGTKAERKQWMNRAIQLIASLLSSEFRTNGIAISTEAQLRSWTASRVPLDDSRQWVSELRISYVKCKAGDEGADIIIERLEN